MPENNKEKVVGEIAKNSLEKVIISLREYRERQLVDIRTYYQNDKGEWLPTKKGISLNSENYPELKQGVLALEEAIKDF
ncbi:MAG: transcriptional coactivator p15/PC4 family protein [Candidatus Nealsonbacteria bacterium]